MKKLIVLTCVLLAMALTIHAEKKQILHQGVTQDLIQAESDEKAREHFITGFNPQQKCTIIYASDDTTALAASMCMFLQSDRQSDSESLINEGEHRPQTLSTDRLGPPPRTYDILSGNGRISIPFEFYRNKFRFKAAVNGRVCNMLLDNGSLWDEFLFFGSPKVDSLGFEISEETAIGSTKADIAKNITVEFKDVVFHEQTAVITRYDPKLQNPWEGFDGQISATFFKHFIVRIDFDKAVIELTPSNQFVYSGTGQTFGIHLGPFASRTMTADIVMQNGKTVTLEMLLDLGGLHPLYLAIGRDDRITLPSDAVEASLGRGLFNQKGYLGTVKSVRFGDYALYNVPTAFTVVDKNSDAYGNTMIGLPLLRRFNLIFDYPHDRIILEPSESFKEPFKVESK